MSLAHCKLKRSHHFYPSIWWKLMCQTKVKRMKSYPFISVTTRLQYDNDTYRCFIWWLDAFNAVQWKLTTVCYSFFFFNKHHFINNLVKFCSIAKHCYKPVSFYSSCRSISHNLRKGLQNFEKYKKNGLHYATHYLVQIHGSQPTHTLPNILGSVAWSSKQSTWSSTLRSFSLCRARILCCSSPRATANIPLYSRVFSNPRQTSSLEH